MSSVDLKKEIPKDQVWVHDEAFERAIYDPDANFSEAMPITRGPKFHWFSYYDKFQTDPADRFALSMEVDFDNRSPTHNDVITIGMIDIGNNCEWIELGKTNAWCWQQGCMLQWRPGSDHEIMWNDRIKDRFVCHILDVKSGLKRTLEHPIYHVHPSGKMALVLDFARIQSVRSGYGYPGVPDKNRNILRPKDSGISVLNIDTGDINRLFSVSDIASVVHDDEDPAGDEHYFNHAAWNTVGSRFCFLHRWRSKTARFSDFRTRMFTADASGGDIRLVTDRPWISHFAWRDSDHIAMWREKGYELYKDDGTGTAQSILSATNGHLSYLPGCEWMIADTYVDRNGDQNLLMLEMGVSSIL